MEMESIREWEMQFKGINIILFAYPSFYTTHILEKYELCGRLLKPGEQPTNYSDDDEEPNTNTSTTSTSATASEKTEDDEVEKKAEAKKSDAMQADSKPKEE